MDKMLTTKKKVRNMKTIHNGNYVPQTVHNMAAMRDALVAVKKLFDACHEKVNRALAAPARQCDVGTEEEQEDRYIKFCDSHTKNHGNCISCPACNIRGRCEFNWAQTPYEEGGVCQDEVLAFLDEIDPGAKGGEK